MWKKWLAFSGMLVLVIMLDPTHTPAQPGGKGGGREFGKGGGGAPGGSAIPGTGGAIPGTGGGFGGKGGGMGGPGGGMGGPGGGMNRARIPSAVGRSSRSRSAAPATRSI